MFSDNDFLQYLQGLYKFNNTSESVIAFVPQQKLVITQGICQDGHYVHEDVPNIIWMAASAVGTRTLASESAYSTLSPVPTQCTMGHQRGTEARITKASVYKNKF